MSGRKRGVLKPLDLNKPVEQRIREKAADLLAYLGKTKHQAAWRLRRDGHKGVRGQADACPVWHLFVAGFQEPGDEGLIEDLSVEADSITLYVDSRHESREWEIVVRTTDPVAEFIGDFDEGHFPSLEREPTELEKARFGK